MKRINWPFFIILTGMIFISLTPAFAQGRSKLPQVTIVPLEQEGDPSYCEPLAATVSDTLALTMHLLGRYDIVRIPDSEWESMDRDELIDKYKLNHLITGKVSAPEEGGVNLTFQVFNTEEQTTSQDLTISSETYMGIFDITDKLMVDIVEEFTQEHFAYGSLSIINEGTAPEYWISLDGEEVGKNIQYVSIVPEGEHRVKIYTKTETDVYLMDIYEITLKEGEDSIFTFTLDADREPSTEKTHPLSDGRTLNMTKVQWKDIWKSSQMIAPRVFQGIGIGLTIPGSLIFGVGTAGIIAVAALQDEITAAVGTGISKDITNILFFTATGFIAATGGALTVIGIIFWVSSPVKRDEKFNNEFTLSASPILAPGVDGKLTAGLSVRVKL